MPCFCQIIPNEVLKRFSKDPRLPPTNENTLPTLPGLEQKYANCGSRPANSPP